MAGHSHWANIARKKGAEDAKRGKLFTKLVKEITVAARMGGGNEEGNPRLKTAVAAAKNAGMPKDNIERAIKKGTGELEGESYEEVVYEGYGPNGVAVMIEATTDNRNRTVADLRNIFDKHGGSLGQQNSVAWMFSRQGRINIEKEKVGEDKVTEAALEAGAEDVEDDGDYWVVVTESDTFHSARDHLENAGIPIDNAGLEMVPQSSVALEGKDAEKMIKLMLALDDNDDVQKVHANFDIPDDQMEALAG